MKKGCSFLIYLFIYLFLSLVFVPIFNESIVASKGQCVKE